SRCQTVRRPPSEGLWDRPSPVKPTDSTGRTAVHRSSALPLAAQIPSVLPLFHTSGLNCVSSGVVSIFHSLNTVSHSYSSPSPSAPLALMDMT
ncbi:hypothetical protein KUCAC02_002508, partial [Chaenocephalus aceratus]